MDLRGVERVAFDAGMNLVVKFDAVGLLGNDRGSRFVIFEHSSRNDAIFNNWIRVQLN